MSAATLRIVGILFLLSSIVLMVLYITGVANLGTFLVAIPLFLIGIILGARSGKAT